MIAATGCKPQLVDHQHAFDEMLQHLENAARLAVDTESNSLYAYQEKICLVQFSTTHSDYVVDALKDLTLKRLGKIFSDHQVEKVFHAAEYDLICLKRDFGFSINHIFDTMHAARVLGMEKLGLAFLLEEQFGVIQGSSFQKADWGKRPLSAEMLAYACMDTHYLIRMRDVMHQLLVEAGRLELAQEDFERLCAVEPNHHATPLYSHVNGYHTLTPRELRVLDELCSFRDQMARKLDRPHFKVIGNHALFEIAQSQPVTEKQLMSLKNISPRVAQRYAQGLLEAVRRGIGMPPLDSQKRARPSQRYINRLEALRQWRKKAAGKMRVQSDIVLPREIMESIAKSNPRDEEALHHEMHTVPWRFAHFGQEILNLLIQGN